MTNEKKTYEEVARLCSKYNPVKCCDSKGCKNSTAGTNGYKNSTAETSACKNSTAATNGYKNSTAATNGYKNSTSETNVSCKTCTHFANSYCDLNLYDEIAKKHNI